MDLGTKAIWIICAMLPLADAQSAAEAELKAGIEAKEQGNSTLAIDYLKRAATLAPGMISIHLKLADTADAWCGEEFLYSSDRPPDLCDISGPGVSKSSECGSV